MDEQMMGRHDQQEQYQRTVDSGVWLGEFDDPILNDTDLSAGLPTDLICAQVYENAQRGAHRGHKLKVSQ